MKILINKKLKQIKVKEEIVSTTYNGFRVFKIESKEVAFAAVLEDGTSAVLLGEGYDRLPTQGKKFVFLHELGHIKHNHHHLAAYNKYSWDISHEYLADNHAKDMMNNYLDAFISAMETCAVIYDLQAGDQVVEDVNSRYANLVA